MEKITHTTNYWLFKPTINGGKYYFVRVKTDGVEGFSWFTGYKNHMGLVSSVGGTLNESLVETLEEEFQRTMMV